MKKNINQNMISLIEYYKMIRLDTVISDLPINRVNQENATDFILKKKEKLIILKKKN